MPSKIYEEYQGCLISFHLLHAKLTGHKCIDEILTKTAKKSFCKELKKCLAYLKRLGPENIPKSVDVNKHISHLDKWQWKFSEKHLTKNLTQEQTIFILALNIYIDSVLHFLLKFSDFKKTCKWCDVLLKKVSWKDLINISRDEHLIDCHSMLDYTLQ